MTDLILYKLKSLDRDESFVMSNNNTYSFLYIGITSAFNPKFQKLNKSDCQVHS